MPKQTPPVPPALTALLAEIDATKAHLAADTPERQRLTLTAWIARARAAQERGHIAERHVHAIAQTLQALGQTWWPGSVFALSRSTRPQRVFAGSVVSLGSWDAVAEEAAERLRRTSGWDDDTAVEPRPFAPASMFAALEDTLVGFGGPLGEPACPSPAVLVEASRRLSDLRRIAAELRWLRGLVPSWSWGAAIGRLRGLARGLGPEGGTVAALLDPQFNPSSWAEHLGRDPRREALLAEVPGPDSDDPSILAWLLRAFDILDNPSILPLCRSFRAQLLGLRPELADRRCRRRLSTLQLRLADPESPAPTESHDDAGPSRSAETVPSVEHARAQFAGRRALFVSNRSFPELETRLLDELGLECEAVASVGAARRRQALLRRIRGGAYDLVLVAHEFSAHADTEQFAEACRAAGVVFCAVGKGRFTGVVSRLLARTTRAGAPSAPVPG